MVGNTTRFASGTKVRGGPHEQYLQHEREKKKWEEEEEKERVGQDEEAAISLPSVSRELKPYLFH